MPSSTISVLIGTVVGATAGMALSAAVVGFGLPIVAMIGFGAASQGDHKTAARIHGSLLAVPLRFVVASTSVGALGGGVIGAALPYLSFRLK